MHGADHITHEALASAWNTRAAVEQAGGGKEVDPEPSSDMVWPPDGAVWLAPIATDYPANPKLLQYAWGRSNLSSGQMAEAYQCIVSAAQDCGQEYRLPLATPPAAQPAQVTEAMIERIKAAEQRIADGHALRRIPADPTDPDLVLSEVRLFLQGEPPPFWLATAAQQPGGE
jgi:hypothetical protein